MKTAQDHQKIIIGSAIVIVGIGLITRLKRGESNGGLDSRVIFGGFAFFMLLGLLSAAGDSAAKVASGLALVTAATTVFYEGAELFGIFNELGSVDGGKSGDTGGFHGPATGVPRGELPHN